MKKLIFTAVVLLMSSLAIAQNFELPKAFQVRFDHLRKVAGKVQLTDAKISHGKANVKNVQKAALIEWDEAAGDWYTDTTQISFYSWNHDGSPKEVSSEINFQGQVIRFIQSDFRAATGADAGDPHLEGYYPALMEAKMNIGTWITIMKMVSEFDATTKHLIRTTTSELDGITLKPSSKTEYNYDTQGSFTGEITYAYENSTWEMEYGDRATFTYNGSDITSAIQEEYWTDTLGNGSWTTHTKEEYTAWNTDGSVKSGIRYAYNDSTMSWVPVGKADNVTWQNFHAKPSYGDDNFFAIGGPDFTFIELYSYNGSGWDLENKITRTYANDMPVSQLEEFNAGGTWMDESKIEWAYYTNGDLKTETEYYYDGTTWVESNYEKYDNTYDVDGDMTVRIEEYGYDGTPYYKLKNVYSYSPATSIAKSAGTVNVSAYPNPVQDLLNINMGEQTAATISIADMTGREVLRSDYTNVSGAIRIDASALPAAQYILTVTTATERYTQPIIKR